MEQQAATTAAACSRERCDDCGIQGELICVATPLDLVDFGILFVNWLIPFLVGMIAGAFWLGLVVWTALVALFFGYVDGDFPELGYFRLSELKQSRGVLGMPIERDRCFRPCRLSTVKREIDF